MVQCWAVVIGIARNRPISFSIAAARDALHVASARCALRNELLLSRQSVLPGMEYGSQQPRDGFAAIDSLHLLLRPSWTRFLLTASSTRRVSRISCYIALTAHAP
jgi:hypothetical protein